MSDWLLLITVTTAGSLISLIGGLWLIYGKSGVDKVQRLAVPLAAGALLAAVFFDLLPGALHEGDADLVLGVALFGFLLFFMMERSLTWFHHHHAESQQGRNVPLIIIGDSLHNFIDGLAIAAAFLVNPATGIVTAIAVAAHEIPQELGDFGLLLERGVSKKRVLLINIFSALLTVAGAALVYSIGSSVIEIQPILLALTAGCFLYIAASDIIPTIHSEPSRKTAWLQTTVLILSALVVASLTYVMHGFIEH